MVAAYKIVEHDYDVVIVGAGRAGFRAGPGHVGGGAENRLC
jgi:pyruvate/2-oxoglutarate dehydrogenase complex dihydrolipoamide dehydrogenase (E3) component